jgi:hypothetical protein
MAIGFSQTFGLNLRFLSGTIRAFADNQFMSRPELMRKLGVGDNKAEAMVTWLPYLGLRDNQKRQLTPLADLLLRCDPYFEDVGTQWVLHYRLASNPQAEVWHAMSNDFLPGAASFTLDAALDFLSAKLQRSGNDRHLSSDLSIFLNAFISPDGLSGTRFLATTGASRRRLALNTFVKHAPTTLPPYVLAYALYDQRDRVSHDLCTTTIQEVLTLPGHAGPVFSLNRSAIESLLKTLTTDAYHRLVQLALTAGLDQVVLTHHGSALNILAMHFERKGDAG